MERERRFLLERFPAHENAVRIRRISDPYIEGTALRLREQQEDGVPPVFKLTQKLPAAARRARHEWVTSIYLGQDEFRVLARLPSRGLRKTRHSVPPFGIDVFEGHLEGLFLAEAEFDSDAAADRLAVPSFLLADVSADDRFMGGRLVRASREEVRTWLAGYGVMAR